VSLFEDQVRSDQQVQALFPKSQRMAAKMRLLLDFLAERLATGKTVAMGPASSSEQRSARSGQHSRRAASDKRAGV
jgi:hypothetical protein